MSSAEPPLISAYPLSSPQTPPLTPQSTKPILRAPRAAACRWSPAAPELRPSPPPAPAPAAPGAGRVPRVAGPARIPTVDDDVALVEQRDEVVDGLLGRAAG